MSPTSSEPRTQRPAPASTSDLQAFGCQHLISASSGIACDDLFHQAHAAFEAAQDETARRVLRFLVHVLSLVLRPDDRERGPLVAVFSGLAPSDLEQSERDVVRALLELPDLHPDVRARLIDVLFVIKQGPHATWLEAPAAYLEAARFLWSHGKSALVPVRLDRALRLAHGFKRSGDETAIGGYVLELLREADDRVAEPEHLALTRLARDLEGANVKELAERCERWAQRCPDTHPPFTRAVWETAADTYALDEAFAAEQRRARLAAAETYVAQADRARAAPHMPRSLEARVIEQAIHALRRIDGTKERREALHERLLAVQKEVPHEYQRVEGPRLDLTEVAMASIQAVELPDFTNAAEALAMLTDPLSKEAARAFVARRMEETTLDRLMTKVLTDKHGRVVKRVPGVVDGDSEDDDGVLHAMHDHGRQHRLIVAMGQLEPARRRIAFDHSPTLETVEALLKDSPFIPAGRNRSFALGLHAGFHGNWTLAAHVLVPQAENAIRQIVAARGGVVSTMTDGGIQNWTLLTPLLESPEAAAAFGDDYLFALKGILLQEGSNLRNLVSHGICSDRELSTYETSYFWWLILHLCLLPSIATRSLSNEAPE